MDQPANTKELYEGELYSLLRDKLPSEYVHDGKVNTRLLSEATENARFTIYRWFHENKLSPKAIKSLLEVSANADRPEEKDRLTKNDLIPFLPIP
ncbi:hypothetical protein N5C81_03900 [Rhizobium pusense]|uniref:hypothetical protein n=1 Tax=Agrobacterium pusense TaxID=648995 RepID=UPI002449A4E9|nr:hypothetical protein [Agrobacterium pusense]MDH1266759.1 hypothetical protein [Agrobacterium pusense]